MKTLIELAFVSLLLISAAFAQQPQWQTAASAVLTQQTSAIPQTTLLTPTDPGMYRTTFYFSGGGGGSSAMGYFNATLQGTDLSGEVHQTQLAVPCGTPRFNSQFLAISLAPNAPLTYKVDNYSNPPGCVYNITVTVEQFK